MKNLVISIIFLASMFVSVNAREFKVADIFSDEMVLQQKHKLRFGVGISLAKSFRFQPRGTTKVIRLKLIARESGK